MPYRIAAPPAPEPPDAEHPYAALLQRERTRARLVAAATGAAVVALVLTALARPPRPPTPPRSDADRADRAVRAIDGARARSELEQTRFAAALAAALHDGTQPRADLGPCPVTLPEPAELTPAFPLLVAAAHDTASLPSKAVAGLLEDVRRAEAHAVAGRFEEASLYGAALARPGRLSHEVVLVASTWRRPRVTSPASYEPGELEGRAYLYDFTSGTVPCAADVRARSSPRIGFAYATTADAPASLGKDARLTASVDDDMNREIAREIARAMRHRAGPAL